MAPRLHVGASSVAAGGAEPSLGQEETKSMESPRTLLRYVAPGCALPSLVSSVIGLHSSILQVLEIDPMTRKIATFGSLGGNELTSGACAGALHCGEYKWIGGVLTANGKILGIPYAAESVLEIDPVRRTATTFGVM